MSETLLQLQSGTKSFGSKRLFDGASFFINADEHVGVIGPNGAGKSTLFRILTGEDELDSGSLAKSKRLSLGYLSQHDHWIAGQTGNEYLEKATKIPIWELKSRGRVLQVSERILDQEVLSLSGGYRMRIKLLGLIGQDPNLMLLDEPTNYLDLETTLVLERFLQGYEGAFLLISHDSEFLRRTTDHILEVESGEMTKFNGNIDDYFAQKELLREQLESRAQGLAKKRADILDFVARFGAKATKARQAQSRLKSLAKMEVIDIKPLPITSAIRIPPPAKTGKMTLMTKNAKFGYGEKVILHDVSLQIMRGDHVAVVGLNGAGKSTLLKGISGELAPLSGDFEFGHNVEIAFYAQHVIEALSPRDTVLSSLQSAAHPDVLPQDILDLAGSLLFSGDDVKKSISVLSGGEKSRVALGRVLLQRAPCLLLDEPTNHLDFQTVEALTMALQAYEGTVIVVSHDRSFTKRIGTKILEVSRGEVNLYHGTYEEYVWSMQQDLARDAEEDSRPAKTPKKNVAREAETEVSRNEKRAQKKALDRDLRNSERKLEEFEEELKQRQRENETLNEKITSHSVPPSEVQGFIQKMSDNSLRIEELEMLWVGLMERQEYLLQQKASEEGE